MKDTLEKLQGWGCDISGTLPRFLDDQGFLLECIVQVSQDEGFAALRQALAEGDLAGAFDTAHMLKGILSNTGLTPLYEVIVQIVEPLRIGESAGLLERWEQLEDRRQELLVLLNATSKGSSPV